MASSEGTLVLLGLRCPLVGVQATQQVLGTHRPPSQPYVVPDQQETPTSDSHPPQSEAGRRQDPHSSHNRGKPSRKDVSDTADNF